MERRQINRNIKILGMDPVIRCKQVRSHCCIELHDMAWSFKTIQLCAILGLHILAAKNVIELFIMSLVNTLPYNIKVPAFSASDINTIPTRKRGLLGAPITALNVKFDIFGL